MKEPRNIARSAGALCLAASLSIGGAALAGNTPLAYAQDGQPVASAEADQEAQLQEAIDQGKREITNLGQGLRFTLGGATDQSYYNLYLEKANELRSSLDEAKTVQEAQEKAKAAVAELTKLIEDLNNEATERAVVLVQTAVRNGIERASDPKIVEHLKTFEQEQIQIVRDNHGNYAAQYDLGARLAYTIYNTLADYARLVAIDKIEDHYIELIKNNKQDEVHYSAEELKLLEQARTDAVNRLTALDTSVRGVYSDDAERISDVLLQVPELLKNGLEAMDAVSKTEQPQPATEESKPQPQPSGDGDEGKTGETESGDGEHGDAEHSGDTAPTPPTAPADGDGTVTNEGDESTQPKEEGKPGSETVTPGAGEEGGSEEGSAGSDPDKEVQPAPKPVETNPDPATENGKEKPGEETVNPGAEETAPDANANKPGDGDHAGDGEEAPKTEGNEQPNTEGKEDGKDSDNAGAGTETPDTNNAGAGETGKHEGESSENTGSASEAAGTETGTTTETGAQQAESARESKIQEQEVKQAQQQLKKKSEQLANTGAQTGWAALAAGIMGSLGAAIALLKRRRNA